MSKTRQARITMPVEVVGQGVASVHLTWTEEHPLTVQMDFVHPDGSISPEETWVLSRDVLADGLQAPAGQGVLRVQPEGLRIRMDLIGLRDGNPFDGQTLYFEPHPLMTFLGRSLSLLPRGMEANLILAALDRELPAILAAGGDAPEKPF